MAKRKTVDVEYMKIIANNYLANSLDKDVEFRRGVIGMLVGILFQSDNYKGYNNFTLEHLQRLNPNAQVPGIIFDESGDGNHQYPDDTRRFYY